MAKKNPGGIRSVRRKRGVLTLLLLLLALPLFPQEGDVNEIRSIERVGDDVLIELYSSREFPVRDALIRLHIGDNEFTRSQSPPDGSLNTLIFILPADQFAQQIESGDPVSVDFGDDQMKWEFGKLDKSLLGKKK